MFDEDLKKEIPPLYLCMESADRETMKARICTACFALVSCLMVLPVKADSESNNEKAICDMACKYHKQFTSESLDLESTKSQHKFWNLAYDQGVSLLKVLYIMKTKAACNPKEDLSKLFAQADGFVARKMNHMKENKNEIGTPDEFRRHDLYPDLLVLEYLREKSKMQPADKTAIEQQMNTISGLISTRIEAFTRLDAKDTNKANPFLNGFNNYLLASLGLSLANLDPKIIDYLNASIERTGLFAIEKGAKGACKEISSGRSKHIAYDRVYRAQPCCALHVGRKRRKKPQQTSR